MLAGARDSEPMSSVSALMTRTCSALADPTRIAIIEALSVEPTSVSVLAEAFPMSLRGVLKHVQILEEAELIRTTKSGRVRRCELDPDGFNAMTTWITETRSRWDRRLDRIELHLRNASEDTR